MSDRRQRLAEPGQTTPRAERHTGLSDRRENPLSSCPGHQPFRGDLIGFPRCDKPLGRRAVKEKRVVCQNRLPRCDKPLGRRAVKEKRVVCQNRLLSGPSGEPGPKRRPGFWKKSPGTLKESIPGKIYANLRRKGTPIPSNDMWLAAQCLETGAELATMDKHFRSVDGLIWTDLS